MDKPSGSGEGVHILLFPYPAQGHMLAMLDLAHHLVLRGLAVTILVTPKNLPSLRPLLAAHSSIGTLVLPFPHHPSLAPDVENVRELGNAGNVPMTNALGKLHAPILQWFRSHPSPPAVIISDFFLGWTYHLAQELGIPRIAFYSASAFLACMLNFLWPNVASVRSLSAVDFPDLPRSPSFAKEHLPSIFRLYREQDPELEFVKNGMVANMSSWGCVFNTFRGLEGENLDHLRKTVAHGRVWGVGPLNLGAEIERPGHVEIMSWLDECPDESVLYACFGSQKLMKRDQMEALASGLERSRIRFIWVVKPITAQQAENGYGSVPQGFEDRVSERGRVIRGWAPQVAILSHRAVGGFLSHCGWNSVLEAVAGGVMILGWPMEADQFVNAKLVVEYLGAGVRVCEGADTVPDPDELAGAIAESMSGGGKMQKKRAKELREEAVEAVREGGRSWLELEDFVREVAKL
ncbi:UDP-glycosyltransferase 89A2-like [Diospyros lotus]|uniref:UDP-glycosyltransferase 89A2-like n=1 Tax=Diospyros lotus TaxID=55363 RepID=UPI0022526629|nr:UDP-glycosyltransferase 89A2-like [Diospyros lotus]